MTKVKYLMLCLFGFVLSPCTIAGSITTNLSQKSTLISPLSSAKTTLASSPEILGFASSLCVKQGSTITVLGRSLGSRATIALSDNRSTITMSIRSWSSTAITATIPKDNRINSNARFFVGIKSVRTGAWVSNTNKYISICNTEINKSTSAEGLSSKTPSQHPDAPASDGNEEQILIQPQTVSPSQTVRPSSNGSLMDRGLAAPPKKLLLLSNKKLDGSKIEPNELIVITKDMNQARQLAKQLAQFGLRIKKRKKLKHLGVVISTFNVPSKIDLQQTAINIRKAFPNMWADANHRYRLQSNGKNSVTAKKLIKWNKANSSCGKGIRIGLIDTEINKNHPALSKQKIISHSVLTQGITKADMEHGTAIASLLIGNHKSKSFSGLLPSASLYAASVFRLRDKHNIDTTAEWIVSALDWLISQKVDVINMSIGGPHNLLVDLAIQQTMHLGIPVIAAAGNNGPNATAVFPAAQKGVIAVTAVDSGLSLYNKANEGDYIDFAAPGVEVWVAEDGSSGGKFLSGTSFSVPFVTASIANMIKKFPAKMAYIKLRIGAKDLGKKGRDKRFGWGLIQHNEKCK